MKMTKAIEFPGNLIEALPKGHAAVFFTAGLSMALDQAQVWSFLIVHVRNDSQHCR